MGAVGIATAGALYSVLYRIGATDSWRREDLGGNRTNAPHWRTIKKHKVVAVSIARPALSLANLKLIMIMLLLFCHADCEQIMPLRVMLDVHASCCSHDQKRQSRAPAEAEIVL